MQSQVVDLDTMMEGRPLGGLQIRVTILCALVALLDGVDTQSFAIAAPAIALTFGMKVTQFGLVFSIAHLGACVGAFTCGPLSDRIGRRGMLIGATLTFAVFTIVTALASSYGALLAMRFCAGLGLGGALPCFLSLASEFAPPSRRGTLASLLWAAFPLGGMVGGFSNAYIVGHYGWPMMFYVGGALPILVAAIMSFGLPESPCFLADRDAASPRLRVLAERLAGRSFDPGTRFAVRGRSTAKIPVTELLQRRCRAVTLLLWLAFFVAFGLLSLTVSWTPAVLQGVGISTAGSAFVLGFFNIGAVLGMGTAGRLVDGFGATRTLIPALAIATGLFWLLGTVTTLWEAAAVTAGIGLFLGCGASGLIAVASSHYVTAIRATGIGWSMGIGRLGQVISPLATGALMAGGLAIAGVMQLMAALPVIAAAAVFMIETARRQGRTDTPGVAKRQLL